MFRRTEHFWKQSNKLQMTIINNTNASIIYTANFTKKTMPENCLQATSYQRKVLQFVMTGFRFASESPDCTGSQALYKYCYRLEEPILHLLWGAMECFFGYNFPNLNLYRRNLEYKWGATVCTQTRKMGEIASGVPPKAAVLFLANVNRARPSVVCNVHAPYSGGSNFQQYFYGIRYLGHPLTSTENFTEIVPGEPLDRGS